MSPLPSQSTPTKYCVTKVILQITIQSPHIFLLRFLLNKEDTSISELTNEFMFNTISTNTHSVSDHAVFFYEIFAF